MTDTHRGAHPSGPPGCPEHPAAGGRRNRFAPPPVGLGRRPVSHHLSGTPSWYHPLHAAGPATRRRRRCHCHSCSGRHFRPPARAGVISSDGPARRERCPVRSSSAASTPSVSSSNSWSTGDGGPHIRAPSSPGQPAPLRLTLYIWCPSCRTVWGGQVLVQEPQRRDVVLARPPPSSRELLGPPEPVVERPQLVACAAPPPGVSVSSSPTAVQQCPHRSEGESDARDPAAAPSVPSAGSQYAAWMSRNHCVHRQTERISCVVGTAEGRLLGLSAGTDKATPRGARAGWPASRAGVPQAGSLVRPQREGCGIHGRHPHIAPPRGGISWCSNPLGTRSRARQRQRRDRTTTPVRDAGPRDLDAPGHQMHYPGRAVRGCGDTGQQRHRGRAERTSCSGDRERPGDHDPARAAAGVGAGAEQASGLTMRCGWVPNRFNCCCRHELETASRPVAPSYRTVTYRSGWSPASGPDPDRTGSTTQLRLGAEDEHGVSLAGRPRLGTYSLQPTPAVTSRT